MEFNKKKEDMSSALGYMHTNIIKIQEKIEIENSGKAIDKIIGILDTKLEQISKAQIEIDEFKDYLENYYHGLDEIDTPKYSGCEYYIDTEVVLEFIKNLKTLIKNSNYDKKSKEFKNEIAEFRRNKKEYEDVNSTINLEEEYPDDVVQLCQEFRHFS